MLGNKLYLMSLVYPFAVIAVSADTYGDGFGYGDGSGYGVGVGYAYGSGNGQAPPERAMNKRGNGFGQGKGWGARSSRGDGRSHPIFD